MLMWNGKMDRSSLWRLCVCECGLLRRPRSIGRGWQVIHSVRDCGLVRSMTAHPLFPPPCSLSHMLWERVGVGLKKGRVEMVCPRPFSCLRKRELVLSWPSCQVAFCYKSTSLPILFSYILPSSLSFFQVGHVIPLRSCVSSNLLGGSFSVSHRCSSLVCSVLNVQRPSVSPPSSPPSPIICVSAFFFSLSLSLSFIAHLSFLSLFPPWLCTGVSALSPWMLGFVIVWFADRAVHTRPLFPLSLSLSFSIYRLSFLLFLFSLPCISSPSGPSFSSHSPLPFSHHLPSLPFPSLPSCPLFCVSPFPTSLHHHYHYPGTPHRRSTCTPLPTRPTFPIKNKSSSSSIIIIIIIIVVVISQPTVFYHLEGTCVRVCLVAERRKRVFVCGCCDSCVR